MFGLDPLSSTLLVAGGIFLVSYNLGKQASRKTSDEMIEQTIIYLCDEGYIKHERSRDGEIEIFKIED